jgi:hypothetical protein
MALMKAERWPSPKPLKIRYQVLPTLGEAELRSRARFVVNRALLSSGYEDLPIGDAVGVAEECRHRQFLRCAR